MTPQPLQPLAVAAEAEVRPDGPPAIVAGVDATPRTDVSMPEPDHVTALATRRDLQARIESLTAETRPFALVICDVVGLKAVNDREGFLAGDTALREAADRLRAAAAGADLVARLGGDELVAVFVGPAGAAAAHRAATVLRSPGSPPLRSAAVDAVAGEPPGPLIERLYATMRRS